MALLCAMLLISLECCVLARRRFETVAPALTGVAVLLCYVLAIFTKLQWFQWIVYLALAALTGALVYRGVAHKAAVTVRSVFQYAITPGFAVFVAAVAVFTCALGTHVVNATDDINYWAVEVKSLYAQGGFVDAYHHLAPRFMSYTPGVQLFQWIGLQIAGEFSEGMLFVALAVFNAIFLLPFGSRLTWKKAYAMPLLLVFIIAVPVLVFRDAYAMLRVDATLGICLGYALCQAWSLARSEKPAMWDALSLGLTLCTLTLVKQVGFGWALLPLSLLLFFRNGKPRFAKQLLLPPAMAVFVFISWLVFAQVKQLNGLHEGIMAGTLSDILASRWQMPQNVQMLPRALWGAVTFADQSALVNHTGASLWYPSILVWVLLITATPFAVSFRAEREEAHACRRLSVWMLCCACLILLAFTGIFLVAFTTEFDSFINGTDARLQYLLERYIGAFLLGGALLGVHLAQHGKVPIAGKLAAAVGALVLLVNWGQVGFHLLPGQYTATEISEITLYQEENYWVSDVENLEEPLDAIILYGIDPTPLRPERLQYAVAPVKIVTFYGDIDENGFISLLKNKHITHVICMDDANPTYQAAQQFNEDGYMDTYTLYTVRWDGDRPVLEYS